MFLSSYFCSLFYTFSPPPFFSCSATAVVSPLSSEPVLLCVCVCCPPRVSAQSFPLTCLYFSLWVQLSYTVPLTFACTFASGFVCFHLDLLASAWTDVLALTHALFLLLTNCKTVLALHPAPFSETLSRGFVTLILVLCIWNPYSP